MMLVYIVFLGLLLLAAASDLASYRIPNAVCLLLVLLFLAAALPHAREIDWPGHLAAGGITLAVGVGLFLARAFGAGDVKLFAATSLWAGWDLLLLHVVTTALIGFLVLVLLVPARFLAARTRRRRAGGPADEDGPALFRSGNGVPYGVAIAASAALLAPRYAPVLWSH